jgi:hypothetical protein
MWNLHQKMVAELSKSTIAIPMSESATRMELRLGSSVSSTAILGSVGRAEV